jgi:hypothetical protein
MVDCVASEARHHGSMASTSESGLAGIASIGGRAGDRRGCAGGTDLVRGLRVVNRVSYRPTKWCRPCEPGSRMPGVGYVCG